MMIGQNHPLANWIRVIDSRGKSVPFLELDPITRTGSQAVFDDRGEIVMNSNGQEALLKWTTVRPFPYDIIVIDPDTRERIKNPCLHELEDLIIKAKSKGIKYRVDYLTEKMQYSFKTQEENR